MSATQRILQSFDVSEEQVRALNKASIEAAKKAYCPYSDVHVGAALLAIDGTIITGCNYENVSYRATICAEATATTKANSMGYRQFKAISVHISKSGMSAYGMPCGLCRQTLVEFGFFPVISCKSETNYIVKTTSSYLPYALRAFASNDSVFFPDANKIPEVLDAAHYYLTTDFGSETRADVEKAVREDNYDELKNMFCKRIDFGTAGLRGKMAGGYAYMNYVTVQQAAQGLCKHLIEEFGKEKCLNIGVVIGYDARHNSKGFAHLSASVFKTMGVKPILYEDYCVTPMVPYYIAKFGELAGVMVTASHNPKQDNGYKVYWENGAQIIEPHDKKIREQIKCSMDLIDLSDTFDYVKREVKFPLDNVREKTIKAYLGDILSTYKHANEKSIASCKPITFTAVHGVGYHLAKRVFDSLGFTNIRYVTEQITPDPEFPTVKYPNPEEGFETFKVSLKCADEGNSSLVIACDPDADRMGVAEKQEDGKWKIFTGDEIGSILASYIMESKKLI